MSNSDHHSGCRETANDPDSWGAIAFRWCAVAIILGHLFAERFGYLVVHSMQPTILAGYLFMVFIGFGLPVLEKTGRARLVSCAVLTVSALPAIYIYFQQFGMHCRSSYILCNNLILPII